MKKSKGKEFLSELKLYSDYLKWDENLKRYETWEEACDKILNTHILRYGDKVKPYLDEVRDSMYNKEFLASQRNLQFREEHILKHNARIYNCCTCYAYSPDVFNKGFYVLLCGTGLGVSLKRKYVKHLPSIDKRGTNVCLHYVEDSIEGWAESLKVLISSFCNHPSLYKEFYGSQIKFDYSLVRPKGSYVSGGFKAPGHEGLKQSLERVEELLSNSVGEFKTIVAYDIIMHMADAVLSGGVRRSATNIILDKEDEELLNAKLGSWRSKYPWRARSNNSVSLIRGSFKDSEFKELVSLNQGDNDIGFVFVNDEDDIFNPCFTKNQKILIEEGWRTFEELLVENNKNVIQDNRVEGYIENNEERWRFNYKLKGTSKNLITKVSKTGENVPVYKLETFGGREVEATPNHHFATDRGMVKLEELKKGDRILVGVPEEFVSDKKTTDYYVGLMYGLFYGDGTKYGGTTFIDVWVVDKEDYIVLNHIENCCEFILKDFNKLKGNESNCPKFRVSLEVEKYTKHRLESTLLTKIFSEFGFEGKDLKNIHKTSKNFKSGFLSGLFYTDGGVDYNKNKRSLSLRIYQSNKEHLKDILLVLQELGIFSKFYKALPERDVIFKEGQKSYRAKESFRIVIRGVQACLKFSRVCELFGSKLIKLKSITKVLKGRDTTYYDKVKGVTYLKNEDVYCLEENVNRTLIVQGLTARRCYEIGFNFYDEIKDKTEAVFQFCNLNEINASACVDSKGVFSESKFYELCRKASILGTLQAGYTSFPYLGVQTEKVVSGEALLGVSITGWMSRVELFNPEILRNGAEIVKKTNEEVANFIGINLAARTTTVKPSGNSSTILQTSSGIHPEHSKRYFRIMQLNKESETAKYLKENCESVLEDSKWSATNSDYVVYSPCENSEDVMVKEEMQGVKHLKLIEMVQKNWVMPGKREEFCYKKTTNHNVSNTVIVDNVDEVVNYIYSNMNNFTAVSFLSVFGDKDYVQAPFTSVLNTLELVQKYGDGSIFMSGLIVDGLHYFDNDLWDAVSYVLDDKKTLVGTREKVLLQKDWLRRVKKISKNYFKNDLNNTIYCMKDVYLWHKWCTIVRDFKLVNFSEILKKPEYEDISKYGAISCSGAACEINF